MAHVKALEIKENCKIIISILTLINKIVVDNGILLRVSIVNSRGNDKRIKRKTRTC